MRVSYDWLRTYASALPPPRELAERLTMGGSAVEAVEEIPGDTCFEIEITSNRADCLCHLGLAREAAALTGGAFALPEITFEEDTTPVGQLAAVDVPASDLCPRYTARVIEDVRIAPSPPWLARRIEAMGLRPVNNVVDVTNFVLFECGQPLHAFDLDRLEGRHIIVRRAEPKETITAIDGTTHELTPDRLVIADERRPVAVAGVMGGLDSEVADTTTRILLESAEFDRVSIRTTSRALNLLSDSSYRFERGIDPLGVGWGSRRAIQLIQQVAGGRIAQGVIDVNFQAHEEPVVALRLSRIPLVLGIDVPRGRVIEILERLDFGVEGGGPDVLRVHVPSFRPDVTREVDLIEEVARLHGYDRVPTRSAMTIHLGRVGTRDRMAVTVRERLTGAGLFEAATFSMLSEEESALFPVWTSGAPVTVDDERRGLENRLRTSLLPSLLKARRTNQDRANVDADLFELAPVYLPKADEPLPDEPVHLGIVATGSFRRIKGFVEEVLDALGVTAEVACEPFENAFFEPGAGARFVVNGCPVGYAGEVSRSALGAVGLKRPALAAELDLDALTPLVGLRVTVQDLPVYPAVHRDLNVVVDAATPWADVRRVVNQAGDPLLRRLVFRETYTGEHVAAGRKSVVFSMEFRADDHTLTHDEADAAQTRILNALQRDLSAALRQ